MTCVVALERLVKAAKFTQRWFAEMANAGTLEATVHLRAELDAALAAVAQAGMGTSPDGSSHSWDEGEDSGDRMHWFSVFGRCSECEKLERDLTEAQEAIRLAENELGHGVMFDGMFTSCRCGFHIHPAVISARKEQP